MIKRKLKKCAGRDHIAVIFAKGLCIDCWRVRYKNPIPKVSNSHLKTLEQYRPKRLAYLEKNPICQLRLSECTREATCIHHTKGKHSIELYLDEKFWMASCVRCNGKVEEIGEKAYELGLKIRHNKM